MATKKQKHKRKIQLTVGKLRKWLEQFSDDTPVRAYEGEISGIIVDRSPKFPHGTRIDNFVEAVCDEDDL